MTPEEEWRAWQDGNRQHQERSLRIAGLPEDLMYDLDPDAARYLGPRPEKNTVMQRVSGRFDRLQPLEPYACGFQFHGEPVYCDDPRWFTWLCAAPPEEVTNLQSVFIYESPMWHAFMQEPRRRIWKVAP